MQRESLALRIRKNLSVYLFLLPGVIAFIIFSYVPMSGLMLAFKKYVATKGIWGSPWIGLDNFRRLFVTPAATEAIFNTLLISCGRLLTGFWVPILIALMLNEMPGRTVKRVYQTVFTFPHFLSWVIVGTILENFMSTNGTVNTLLGQIGISPIGFLSNKQYFRPLLYITDIWKEAGWSSILYIAAISGIDPGLYEAAVIDGASRLQRIWHVTLPGIRSTIVILLILQIGNMMNAGFDQIFNLRNPVVKGAGSIIDTYVYDITFEAVPSYGFSTAVGMFKSVINMVLLTLANIFSKKITGSNLFGGGN